MSMQHRSSDDATTCTHRIRIRMHAITPRTATCHRHPRHDRSRSNATSWRRTSYWPNAIAAGSPADRYSALNLMSSPGAGKTTLLERTIRDLGNAFPLHGDRRRPGDAQRRRADSRDRLRAWCRSTPAPGAISTRRWRRAALTQLDPPLHSVVMIENVGNLVCPALFDLGEAGEGVDSFGDRGRGQADQVSAYVSRVFLVVAEQDRLAAAFALRCGAVHRVCEACQSYRCRFFRCRRRAERAWKGGMGGCAAALLLRHHDLDAPVFHPAVRRVVGCNRFFIAFSGCNDTVRRQTRCEQYLHDVFRALFGQRLVGRQ